MAKTTYAMGLISAIAASASLSQDRSAYADGPFNFPPFSSSPAANVPHTSPPAQSASPGATANPEPSAPKARNDNPRTSSSGFDPEALERGAKALREISSSSHAKKVSIFFHLFCFSWFLIGFCSAFSVLFSVRVESVYVLCF